MSCDERLRPHVLGAARAALPAALGLFLDLHRHPELSGKEQRTARLFAHAAEGAGFTTTRGVGGHGVVAVLRNGAGPTVLVRTELDALPVGERTGLAYASRVRQTGADGRRVAVMHACGHDAHIAAVIGTARVLAGLKEQEAWRGTVVLVAQPAEEALTGARAMLGEGLYRHFPPLDAVLAQHVVPLPAGVLAYATGPVTAAGAKARVYFRGSGGHAVMPWRSLSPLEVAARTVLRLRSAMPPHVLLGVGSFRSGDRADVSPDRAVVSITVRTFDQARLTEALAVVESVARAENARMAGAQPVEVHVDASAPLLRNTPALEAELRQAHTEVFGAARVTACLPFPILEDFAWYGPAGEWLHGGSGIKVCYWFVGCAGAPPGRSAPASPAHLAQWPPNHSPYFIVAPMPTLRTAVGALTTGALSVLAGPGRE
ncbi:amidohydrolase [Streptomyces sp. cg36]|uniref:amidohydrolase n=1 Tax=Streptomyces sp. cg36 TaxID=3238798 RepID=UPI0034E1FC86